MFIGTATVIAFPPSKKRPRVKWTRDRQEVVMSNLSDTIIARDGSPSQTLQGSIVPLSEQILRAERHTIAASLPLDFETCSLERFAAFIATRNDRETLRRYAAIIEAREWDLFAEVDAEFAAYDAEWDAMYGQPTLFEGVAA